MDSSLMELDFELVTHRDGYGRVNGFDVKHDKVKIGIVGLDYYNAILELYPVCGHSIPDFKTVQELMEYDLRFYKKCGWDFGETLRYEIDC
ncbi:hypothetical protein [Aeoliella sp.]|uniref:hypothetical protein n=1 Tax=Aeoliella sp. TaxID=2795800 RepID=UPI003CCB782D